MNYLQDIIIAIVLIISLLLGLFNGTLKRIWKLIVFAILFSILFFLFKDVAINFLRYDLLKLFAPNGYTITIDTNLTVVITNIEDVFVVLQNLDPSLSGEYLKLTCELTCTIVYFVACLLVSIIVGEILSVITYFFLKYLFPESWRKPKFLSRLFGAIFSVIQWFFIIFMNSISLGQFSGLLENFVPIFQEIPNVGDMAEQIDQIVSYVLLVINPYNSIIMSSIYNALLGNNIDPYSLLSFEYDGLKITFEKAFEPLYKPLQELIGYINSSSQGGGEEVSPTNLANLGFNYFI